MRRARGLRMVERAWHGLILSFDVERGAVTSACLFLLAWRGA